MADYVGAVDQGTTSTRFMIFDHDGREVARSQLEHEQVLPRSGWVEHRSPNSSTSLANRRCEALLAMCSSLSTKSDPELPCASGTRAVQTTWPGHSAGMQLLCCGFACGPRHLRINRHKGAGIHMQNQIIKISKHIIE